MKLTKITIKNYRSLFSGPGRDVFELELAEGMNAFVGPNNTGKSNILRAVALAMDPGYPFRRANDVPGTMLHAVPRVTLEFSSEGKGSVEKTMLRYAEVYERTVHRKKRRTYAEDGVLRLSVSFPGTEGTGATRLEILNARGAGARQGDPDKLAKALGKFRDALRFVMIESGQNLETLLAGKFREILHSVIRENLKKEFEQAERRRAGYIENLQDDLLAPLKERITGVLGELFPEIEDASLIPEVTGIDETLSNVGINLRDAVDTELAAKGTGIRGVVMVAMLRYLAERSRRSLVIAVEEPEAFLHPAAQENLRDDLESLAERSDVSLLVTTHSPFVISRDAKAQVVGVTKDKEGRTRIAGSARADESFASLIGGLFRDSYLADVIDRGSQVPEGTRAIVFVEGTTDEDYLRLAAQKTRRPDLLAGIHVVAAGGALKLVAEAALMKVQSPLPVCAILDSDANGQQAKKLLARNFGFHGSREILSYAELFEGKPEDVEAEDLFPENLLKRFVQGAGEEAVLSEKRKHPKTGLWHYGFNAVGKDSIRAFLDSEATADDFEQWIELLLLLQRKLRLGGSATEQASTVPASAAESNGLVEELKSRILALGDGITEKAQKRGGYSFKVNKRPFVTVVPRKSGARLGLALEEPFEDPEGLTRKIPNGSGVWAFDARITGRHVKAALGLIRQAHAKVLAKPR